MLPVLVCAEGFLLSHTSEVVDVPEPGARSTRSSRRSARRTTGCSIPREPRAFSALPEPNDYAAFQRNVAEAMDEARAVIDGGRRRSSPSHFGRDKVGALEVAGNPDADTRARHHRDDRRHGARAARRRRRPAARPRPRVPAVPGGRARRRVLARRLPCLRRRPRAAFGSLGPLGGDVRVARPRARAGGHELRLRPRRHGRHARHAALGARATRSRQPRDEPVYVPEGV